MGEIVTQIAYIFPGQGAQYIGMAKDFYDNYEESRQVFQEAEDVLNMSIADICFVENELLNVTEYTQIAMLTATVAILRKVESMGYRKDVTAGLSLGEYPALVASGVLSLKDAFHVVRQRGILMQEAVPPGIGTMSAVLGLDGETVRDICSATNGVVTVANYNCPGQIVISGEVKAVELASIELKVAGAKRVIPLNVSGPFHSPLLQRAGEELIRVLDTVTIDKPLIPYVDNTNGEYIYDNTNIKNLLGKQVYSSVLWQQSVETMISHGVDTFIEIGPGRTLTSFIKKISRDCKIINIEKIADLDKLQEVPTC